MLFLKVLWLSKWKPSGGGHALRSKGGCDGSAQRASEGREKNYTPRMWRQEHLSKVPDLCVFITSHISLTPYSFEFHKGSDVSCCGVKHTSSQFQVLAMQRQPTPRLVQKLNWRRWPTNFVAAIFSLVTAIYWARYCCRSNWHKTWSYHSFISIKNIELWVEEICGEAVHTYFEDAECGPDPMHSSDSRGCQTQCLWICSF